MTIKKSIEHFKWRFSNGWNPTNRDIDSLNTIIEFVQEQQRVPLSNNQLFAKLYITLYGELLKYYDTTVIDNTPQKTLHQILDTPLETIIHKFLDKANLQEQTEVHRAENGIKHPQTVNTGNIEPFKEAMTYQEAEDNLTAMINMAINKYK